jgi:hypothetical protein
MALAAVRALQRARRPRISASLSPYWGID